MVDDDLESVYDLVDGDDPRIGAAIAGVVVLRWTAADQLVAVADDGHQEPPMGELWRW